MKRVPVSMGADGVAHPTAIFPTLLNNMLGTRLKVVSGYRGSHDIFLAMERGEVSGTVFSWETIRSTRPQWLENKLVVPVLQVSLEKDPDLPNVPLIADLVNDAADRELVKFLVVGSKVGRAFAAPPGVPADRLAALRKAFDETMKDPAFLAAAKKARMTVNPTPGIETQKLVAKYAATPPAVVERARKLIGLKD
jgi:tripartite-type tricarboxylate transporter receptor subunit TctC